MTDAQRRDRQSGFKLRPRLCISCSFDCPFSLVNALSPQCRGSRPCSPTELEQALKRLVLSLNSSEKDAGITQLFFSGRSLIVPHSWCLQYIQQRAMRDATTLRKPVSRSEGLGYFCCLLLLCFSSLTPVKMGTFMRGQAQGATCHCPSLTCYRLGYETLQPVCLKTHPACQEPR